MAESRSALLSLPMTRLAKLSASMIEPDGGFILVHIATSVETCEQRDRKGLYAKARAGILKEFTGISDPYEEPKDAEVVINTAELSPEEAAQEIILHLEREGFIGVNGASSLTAVSQSRPSCTEVCYAHRKDSDRLRGRHPDRHDRGGRRRACCCPF